MFLDQTAPVHISKKRRRPLACRLLLLALLATAATGLQACDSALEEDPESFVSPSNFFRNAADAEAAVNGAYAQVVSFYDGQYSMLHFMITADIGRTGPDHGVSNRQNLTRFIFSPTNPDYTNFWNEMYELINRANEVVRRVPEIDMDPELRSRYVAEGRFLRALAYYNLVRAFGDVPLVTSPTTSLDSLEVGRAPSEEVYAQVVRDFEAAVENLPSQAETGRASRPAAQALLAKVHLDRQEWQEGRRLSEAVMENYSFGLLSNFADVFRPAGVTSREMIFAADHEGTTLGNSFYSYFAPRELGAGNGGGWAVVQPTQKHVDSYPEGSYRKDVTYWTDFGVTLSGDTIALPYPHIQKFRPSNPEDIYGHDDHFPIVRYADVILVRAMAENELGNTAQAIELVNRVRRRARNGNDGASPQPLPASLSQREARGKIYQERRWELAHEMKRKFDFLWLDNPGEAFVDSVRRFGSGEQEGVGNVAPRHIRYPIPQSEIDVNPSLEQSPAYQ